MKAEYAALNASKVIQKKGDNWIVVVGLVSRNAAQTGGLTVKAARHRRWTTSARRRTGSGDAATA